MSPGIDALLESFKTNIAYLTKSKYDRLVVNLAEEDELERKYDYYLELQEAFIKKIENIVDLYDFELVIYDEI